LVGEIGFGHIREDFMLAPSQGGLTRTFLIVALKLAQEIRGQGIVSPMSVRCIAPLSNMCSQLVRRIHFLRLCF